MLLMLAEALVVNVPFPLGVVILGVTAAADAA